MIHFYQINHMERPGIEPRRLRRMFKMLTTTPSAHKVVVGDGRGGYGGCCEKGGVCEHAVFVFVHHYTFCQFKMFI